MPDFTKEIFAWLYVMISSSIFEKIRKSRKILIFSFCAFMIWAYFSSQRLGTGLFDNGPYTQYYNNKIIQNLNYGAFILDIFICLSVVIILFVNKATIKLKKILIFLLFIGIILIWLELYYGSTFYYGEIRGMQMLPLLVNNFGVLGSTIFLHQIFKELTYDLFNNLMIRKFPLLTAILINAALSFFLNRPWSFHL